jgi:hypothetical protein
MPVVENQNNQQEEEQYQEEEQQEHLDAIPDPPVEEEEEEETENLLLNIVGDDLEDFNLPADPVQVEDHPVDVPEAIPVPQEGGGTISPTKQSSPC